MTAVALLIHLEDEVGTHLRRDDAGPARAHSGAMTTTTAVDDVLRALEGADGASLIPFIDLEDAEEVEALVAILTWRAPVRQDDEADVAA